MRLRLLGTTAVAAAALIGANLPARAVTLMGASLSDVTFNTGPADTSASFSGGVITLSSQSGAIFDANNSATWVPAFNDVGSVTINNGAVIGGQQVSLGNLNSLLTAGIQFNTANQGTPGLAPYWQVMLQNPDTSAAGNAPTSILIRAGGSNTTGVSIFGANQGPGTSNQLAGASLSFSASGVTYNNAWSAPGGPFGAGANSNPNAALWTTIQNVIIDGTALGTWGVESVGIAIGGYNGNFSSGTIDSITVPSVAAVPEPSTWAMMMLGFAGLGLLSYRRTRRNGGLNLRFA